jgi:multidrug transporter EmrE-like cation transporter
MTTLYLVLAIIFEAGWAIAMKLSSGFSRPVATLVTVVAYVLSLVFLTLATRRMEIGTAYALWAGSGVALIAAAGVIYFKEPVTGLKLASMALILAGIVGLQLSGGAH